MKKMLLAVLLVIFATGVWAAGQPLACQEERSGGLFWENGDWIVSRFKLNRFVLVLEGDTITKKSAKKALRGAEQAFKQVTCTNLNPEIRCEDMSGGSLFYDPRTNRGGIAQIFGATSTGNERDSLSVSAFTCQPF